jgi:uncharacterized membrane protein YozB (DUF420 family)
MSTILSSGGKSASRRFYAWAGALAALIVFAGFAQTFYLKGMFETPPLSGLLMVHGIIMTLWFVLFMVQVRLNAVGRNDLHRRLGVLGAILAGLVMITGIAVAIDSGRRGFSPSPDVPSLVFMVVPLFDIAIFAALVGVALGFRHRSDIHKRLMLLATLSILAAPIARIPLDFIAQGGVPVFFGLMIVFMLACVAVDTVRNRRLHPAFGWGGGMMILSVPLRLVVGGTETWQQFAGWLIR